MMLLKLDSKVQNSMLEYYTDYTFGSYLISSNEELYTKIEITYKDQIIFTETIKAGYITQPYDFMKHIIQHHRNLKLEKIGI